MPDLQMDQAQMYGPAPAPYGAITTLLSRLNLGEREVFDDLVPLVYQELRRIAQAYLRRESRNLTLQPTALIHEAYMRMAQSKADYENRKHFFAIAARVMRQILVDYARARSAAKRGRAVTTALDRGCDVPQERDQVLISLDDALKALAQEDEWKARLVEMRFFGGMTAEEIADSVGAPVHVVRRDLRTAQIRLRQQIEQ